MHLLAADVVVHGAETAAAAAAHVGGGGIGMYHYLVVAAAMFGLGVVGFLSRRNLIIMFLCTELMFQGVGLTLITFSKFHGNHTGEVFVIFVLTIAAAEAALALALVVLLFKRRETLDAQEWSLLKG